MSEITDVNWLNLSETSRSKIFYKNPKIILYTTTDSQQDNSIIFTATDFNAEILLCENDLNAVVFYLYALGYINSRDFNMLQGYHNED